MVQTLGAVQFVAAPTGDDRCSTNCLSAAQMSFTTVVHSPAVACRNSLAVGYQGVSLRSSNHRQSGMKGNSTHTGRPNAPARLTMDVSIEITRSKDIIMAAVSSKSFISLSSRIMYGLASKSSSSPWRRSFCKLKYLTPSLRVTGKMFFKRIDQIGRAHV